METGVTIPNIRLIVDSCLRKIQTEHRANGCRSLDVKMIDHSSSDQRKGTKYRLSYQSAVKHYSRTSWTYRAWPLPPSGVREENGRDPAFEPRRGTASAVDARCECLREQVFEEYIDLQGHYLMRETLGLKREDLLVGTTDAMETELETECTTLVRNTLTAMCHGRSVPGPDGQRRAPALRSLLCRLLP